MFITHQTPFVHKFNPLPDKQSTLTYPVTLLVPLWLFCLRPQWLKNATRANLTPSRRTTLKPPNKPPSKPSYRRGAKRTRRKVRRKLQPTLIKELNRLRLWDFSRRNKRPRLFLLALVSTSFWFNWLSWNTSHGRFKGNQSTSLKDLLFSHFTVFLPLLAVNTSLNKD